MADVSAKEMAILLDVGIDAKGLRRFAREYVKAKGGVVGVDTPGRGGSWTFDDENVDVIRAQYLAWRKRSGVTLFVIDDDGDDA